MPHLKSAFLFGGIRNVLNRLKVIYLASISYDNRIDVVNLIMMV